MILHTCISSIQLPLFCSGRNENFTFSKELSPDPIKLTDATFQILLIKQTSPLWRPLSNKKSSIQNFHTQPKYMKQIHLRAITIVSLVSYTAFKLAASFVRPL